MLRFAVLSSQWAAEGEVFGGGVHEIARPSGKLLRALAGAEAAGSVEILKASREHRASLGKHVESQAAGEKAYAKAQQDGRWLHGNLSQFVASREDRIAWLSKGIKILSGDGVTVFGEHERARLEADLTKTQAELELGRRLLADMEAPS